MNLLLKLIASPWFWLDVLLSVSGGALVWWGLRIEKKAENLLPPENFKPDIFFDIVKRQKSELERGWRILMLGIVVEVVAALGVSIISNLESVDLKDRVAKANERVANIESNNAVLVTIGERSKESAAQAIEAAEKAKTEREKAESGRLELEKQILELEARTSSRTISQKTRETLAFDLNGVTKGAVEIIMSDNDAECMTFGLEIKKVLLAAGFTKVLYSPRDIFRAIEMFPATANSGIDLMFCVKNHLPPAPLDAERTLLAFREGGINADGWPYNDSLGTNDFQIWVLPKPVHLGKADRKSTRLNSSHG